MAAMRANMPGGVSAPAPPSKTLMKRSCFATGSLAEEIDTMNIHKIGAALAIFVTAGLVSEARAETLIHQQPPTVQMAARPDTTAMPGVYGTTTTAPTVHMPGSNMPNEKAYERSFPDDNGFGKWWVGD
jgi:hypothetical protein